MRISYGNEAYLKECIKCCQERGHIQQVAFSTFHNALTQICFTCEKVRTSISYDEVKGSRKNKSLRGLLRVNK